MEDSSMKPCRWAWRAILATSLALAGGCGRPTLPGTQFSQEKTRTPVSEQAASPLPEEPILEWGDPEAEVRVVAFFPIDDDHAALRDLLRGLAEEHAGQIYVKYVDPRTPEGNALFRRGELQVTTVLINAESTVIIEANGRSAEVTFAREMGRFWTANDLKRAVAQEVGKAYGGTR
jgi:hypothetical protein